MGEVIGVLILIAIAIYKISGQKKQPPAARKSRPPRPPRMWTEPSPMNAVPEDMTPEEMQSEDMTPEDMRPLEAEESAQETMEGLSVAQIPGHEHHDPTEGSIDLPEGSQEGTSQWTEKPRAQAEPVKAGRPAKPEADFPGGNAPGGGVVRSAGQTPGPAAPAEGLRISSPVRIRAGEIFAHPRQPLDYFRRMS